jgi:hypothetical protein
VELLLIAATNTDYTRPGSTFQRSGLLHLPLTFSPQLASSAPPAAFAAAVELMCCCAGVISRLLPGRDDAAVTKTQQEQQKWQKKYQHL